MAVYDATEQEQKIPEWPPLSLCFTNFWETGGWGEIFRSQGHRPPSARTRTGTIKAKPRKPAERM